MRTHALLGVAALAAALSACAHQTPQKLSLQKAREAYAVGQRLAAQDRMEQNDRRTEMARLVTARVTQSHDEDRAIRLLLRFTNRSAKPIRSIEAALEVRDARGNRLGLTELPISKSIAAHQTAAFWYPVRYVRFDENAGTLRLAEGRHKTVHIDVTEIKYADGSDAGYDD